MKSNLSLTLVLALCTMLGALGIDTYLPSFTPSPKSLA